MSQDDRELKKVSLIIQRITFLSKNLPTNIAMATKDDKLYSVFTRPSKETEWMTFNANFDAVFAEDRHCRDKETGRLQFVRRGALGMELVCDFLLRTRLQELPLELVTGKLKRLETELACLVYVLNGSMLQIYLTVFKLLAPMR
jgi:hypothetical protein